MYFLSDIFLKDNINEARDPLFQLTDILDKTHLSHKNLVNFCCEVHYMLWVNQYLELQELEDCVKSNLKK